MQRLCHFESRGVQTLAAPLSPIQWAEGFRKRLNAEARDCLQQGARTKPGLRGLGAHRRDTCHSACACSRDAAGSWIFRTVSERTRTSLRPRRVSPRDIRAFAPTGIPHWCTTMTGAVDVPTFPIRDRRCLFAQHGSRLFHRILKAPCWAFRFRSSSEDFNSVIGAHNAPPGAPASFQPSRSRVLEQRAVTAASHRHAVCLGDYALVRTFQGYP